MPKPWEQQKGETDKAYAAFLVFRNMEPEKRTLKDAYNLAYNKSAVGPHRRHASGQWKTWHDNWQWQERADAWDAEQYRKEEAALEKERIKYKVLACRKRLRQAAKEQELSENLHELGQKAAKQLENEKSGTRGGRRKVILRTSEGGMVIEEIPGAFDAIELSMKLGAKSEKTQRIEFGEVTERIASDVKVYLPEVLNKLLTNLRENLSDIEFDEVEETLVGIASGSNGRATDGNGSA